MRLWTGSPLVQIMACRLDGAKPLSEPMLPYYQLDPKEHISMKFYLRLKYFHSRKYVRTCRLWNSGHFVQGEMSYTSLIRPKVQLPSNSCCQLVDCHQEFIHILGYIFNHFRCCPAKSNWQTYLIDRQGMWMSDIAYHWFKPSPTPFIVLTVVINHSCSAPGWMFSY